MVGRVFTLPDRSDHPEVAELFVFCRSRLAELRREPQINDIDVGRLLDFDYKYTHQFRHGRVRLFNIRHIARLAACVQAPIQLLIRIMRRELSGRAALTRLHTWQKLRAVSAQGKLDGMQIELQGALLTGHGELQDKLNQVLPGLLQQTDEILGDADRLTALTGQHAGGSPADRRVVELLHKPKLAMPRRTTVVSN